MRASQCGRRLCQRKDLNFPLATAQVRSLRARLVEGRRDRTALVVDQATNVLAAFGLGARGLLPTTQAELYGKPGHFPCDAETALAPPGRTPCGTGL